MASTVCLCCLCFGAAACLTKGEPLPACACGDLLKCVAVYLACGVAGGVDGRVGLVAVPTAAWLAPEATLQDALGMPPPQRVALVLRHYRLHEGRGRRRGVLWGQGWGGEGRRVRMKEGFRVVGL